jgi:beta-lactamase class A
MADLMITESDNSATNLLLDYIGGQDALNRAFRNWGLKSSQISNWLPDLEGTNKMSAKDLSTILYNLDNPLFLSTKSREYIKDYMSHVKTDTLLPQGLEEGSIIYHKTGDIGTFVGDSGVIYTKSGKKYIATVIVQRNYNDHRAKEYIQNISKTIYNHIEYKM